MKYFIRLNIITVKRKIWRDNKFQHSTNRVIVLKNYLKTAFRNFRKNKIHSLINLLSLCIGITCCILIYTYVNHELSYDDFFKKSEQIYRVELIAQDNHQLSIRYANLIPQASLNRLTSVPGIKKQTRFAPLSTIYVRANEKKIAESDFMVGDAHFFSLFNLSFIKGNKKTALNEPKNIVINEEIAQKYFGDNEAIGKTLTLSKLGNETNVTVTGIVENLPSNSHLKYDAVTSSSVSEALLGAKLSDIFIAYTYLILGENQNPTQIENKLAELSKATNTNPLKYRLEALTDIHLHSSDRYEIATNSNIRYIYFLSAIGIILLIIAGINFTSLSTAKALSRYTEAGVRKVLGAQKTQLIAQFLFEAAFMAFTALLLSYLVIYLILPSFNTLTGLSFVFTDFINLQSLGIFLLASIGIGVIAAFYPAIVMAAFKPVKILKGITPPGKQGASLWKSIVVVQFAASIIMIVCTVTIYQQLSYIQNKNLGFNKERVLTFSNFTGQNFDRLKSRLQNIPGVQQVSMSSYIPGISKSGGTAQIYPEGRADTLVFNWISVDYNYFDTYDIKLKEGRTFSRKRGTDSTQAFVLNKAAVSELGWQSPIGKEIKAFRHRGKIIGVTGNFNYLSLYQDYTPMIFLIRPDLYFNYSLRLKPEADITNTIAKVRNEWNQILPKTPFEYSFVDSEFDKLYKADQQMGTFFGIIASLALFIACLGLFSLSSFTAAKKRKEIGIRKVLGASTTKVLASFYQKYLKLILVASLIAVPISYYLMSDWLQNFAFKVSLSWWIFIFAIVSSTVVAILAVSYESIRAALANPIHALKRE